MSRTNVKSYTDKELIDRMRSLPSFKGVPDNVHIIAVRSKADEPDVFDDKLYLFRGHKFLAVMPCTTNSGTYGLLNFMKWNSKGTAVIKFDEIYYDTFFKSDGIKYAHHNGKLQCLRQVLPMMYYRDNNKNKKIDECGQVFIGIQATNVHCNSYVNRKGILSWFIGGWSTGCTVINNLTMYWDVLMVKIDYNTPVTYTGLKEF